MRKLYRNISAVGLVLAGAIAGYITSDYIPRRESKETKTIEEIVKNDDYSHLRVYEPKVRGIVQRYNDALKLPTPLDAESVLAMIHVESGSILDRYSDFKCDPLQVLKDHGQKVILENEENIPLVGDNSHIKEGECEDSNLEIGVMFLYNKAIMSDVVVKEWGDVVKYKVQEGDNYSVIARKEGTTVDTIKKYNPDIDSCIIHQGQELVFRKAEFKRIFTGWRSWNDAIERYNGKGVPNYLERVLKVKKELSENI